MFPYKLLPFVTGIFLYLHQKKGNGTDDGVKTVDHKTNFHKVALYLCQGIGDNGKNAAENHEGCVAGNHNMCTLQCPVKHPERQDCPWYKEHNGADGSQNFTFHKNHLLSACPNRRQAMNRQKIVMAAAAGIQGISFNSVAAICAAIFPCSITAK